MILCEGLSIIGYLVFIMFPFLFFKILIQELKKRHRINELEREREWERRSIIEDIEQNNREYEEAQRRSEARRKSIEETRELIEKTKRMIEEQNRELNSNYLLPPPKGDCDVLVQF